MKTKGPFRVIGVNIFLLVMLTELASYGYIRFLAPELGSIKPFPTYLDLPAQDRYYVHPDPISPHIIDTTLPWVAWHPRNVAYRQHRSCFDGIMRFNREGTRGRLPDSSDCRTVVFLGDSFTEGYGLQEDSTVCSRLSRLRGLPVLNLGLASSGTTLQSMIYRHFPSR